MISVIIPKSLEGELTVDFARDELVGIEHEIIVAHDFNEGLARASKPFVSFLEKDCVLSPGYFGQNLKLFGTHFRKLAMVVPALGLNSWDDKLYGYSVYDGIVRPLKRPASQEPHLIQVGYFPGAIFRTSVLQEISPVFNGHDLYKSVDLSLQIWSLGSRCILNPHTTYVSTAEKLGNNYATTLFDDKIYDLSKLWHRESIL